MSDPQVPPRQQLSSKEYELDALSAWKRLKNVPCWCAAAVLVLLVITLALHRYSLSWYELALPFLLVGIPLVWRIRHLRQEVLDVLLLQEERRKEDAAVFRYHPLPMWVFDKTSQAVIVANQATLHLFDMSLEQFCELRPEQRGGGRRRSDEPDGVGHLRKLPSGVPVRLWDCEVVMGGRDLILRTAESVGDLTHARRAMEEHERRYRQLIDYLPDGVLIQQQDVLIFANPAAQQILAGRSKDSVLRLPLWSFVLEPTKGDSQPREAASVGGVYMERRLRRLDGTEFDAEIASTPTLVGGKPAVQMIIRDISEAKALRKRLTDANQRLQYMSSRMLEIQEQERKAMSRELHDEVGQNLTALKIHLQMASRRQDKPVNWDNLMGIADTCVQQIRDLSLMLRPPQLDTLGLAPALQWLLDGLSSLSIKTSLHIARDLPVLADSMEVALFRIVQEGLNNVVKHARADIVDIHISYQHQRLIMTIEDDGCGFDDQSEGHKGLGLISMSERTALLGGELVVSSRPGLGTKLQVSLPLQGRHQGGFSDPLFNRAH